MSNYELMIKLRDLTQGIPLQSVNKQKEKENNIKMEIQAYLEIA